MSSKYIIDGIPLDVYCKNNNLNLRTQSNRVRNYIKANPNLSQEEAIKLALSKCGQKPGKTCAKYIYKGITLAAYCEQNNKNYYSYISRIDRIKALSPNILDTEAVRIAIEDYNDNGIKYFYQNIPLFEYCEQHPKYTYSSISTYIRRKLEKNPDANTQDIINNYFKETHNPHIYHAIDGMNLQEYCQKHNFSYSTIMSRLYRMRHNIAYKNLTEENILQLALSKPQYRYLFYKGIPLYTYCKDNNFSYNSIYAFVINLVKEKPELTYEQAIELAITTIKRYGIKYYYQDIPLFEYCKKHNLRVSYIRNRILILLSLDGITLENAVTEAVKYYERKQHFYYLKRIFKYLNEFTNPDYTSLKQILTYLQIEEVNLEVLKDYFPNIRDIIYFIWYFHDNNENQLLSVSLNKAKEIFEQINSLNNIKQSKIMDIDMKILLGLYKANIMDTRYLIILHEENYIYYTLSNLETSYNLVMNKIDKEEIIDDCKIYLLELIENNNNNNIAMFISYITKSIRGFLTRKLIEYIKNRKNISIYSEAYKQNNKTRKNSYLIEYLENKDDDHQFNPLKATIDGALNTLDDISKAFVYYKFYVCLNNEEIANILNIKITDLEFLEKSVLESLKNNDIIKSLHLN